MTRDLWTTPAWRSIAALVAERTGLVFSPNRQASAESGMRRAMSRAGIGDPERYVALIADGGAALDDLLAELTVGETYFMREPRQLDFMRREVLPWIVRRRGAGHAIRGWSAGCASGEEPYSMAMVIGEETAIERARVLGTDISRARLSVARAARYRPWSLRGADEAFLSRYFERRADIFLLDPAVRRAVEFRYLNLAEDTYPSLSSGVWGMDVIMCRNVLIYFDAPTIERVARRLFDSLAEDGWLLLGASDPPLAEYLDADMELTGAGAAYRRGSRRGLASRGASVGVPRSVSEPSESTVERALTSWPDTTPSIDPVLPRESPTAAADTAAASIVPEPESEQVAELPADPDANPLETAYARRDFAMVAEIAAGTGNVAKDTRSAVLLVRSLANLGRFEDAGQVSASALDAHRGSAELQYLHAVLLAQSGRHADAAAAARRALYLDRACIVAHLALASALTRLGRPEDADRSLAAAERMLSAIPRNDEVPASDGESAGRLLEMVRVQRRLLNRSAA